MDIIILKIQNVPAVPDILQFLIVIFEQLVSVIALVEPPFILSALMTRFETPFRLMGATDFIPMPENFRVKVWALAAKHTHRVNRIRIGFFMIFWV